MDDSSTVAEITKAVCARIGLQNPEEFSFITEEETAEMTLKRVGERERVRERVASVSCNAFFVGPGARPASERNGQTEETSPH